MKKSKEADSEARILIRKKVYDPIQRLLHTLMALAVFLLLGTAWGVHFLEKGLQEKSAWLIHIFAGYALTVVLTLRIVWGFLGPRHAKWKDLWHFQIWKRWRHHREPRWGHDPMASLAYIGLYLVLFAMVATGLALTAVEHSAGPLADWLFDEVRLGATLEEPHELLSYVVLAFIGTHIGAMILHERIKGTPIAQSMVSGFQYRNQVPSEATDGNPELSNKKFHSKEGG